MPWSEFLPVGSKHLRSKKGPSPIECKRSVAGRVMLSRLTGDSYQKQLSGKNKINQTEKISFVAEQTASRFIGQAVHLIVGKYTLSWTQNESLSSNTRNTPRYSPASSTNWTYQSASENNNLDAGRKSWTINITIEGDYVFNYWVNTPNMNVSMSDFQLEEGLVATDYEPYCGDIPSPNPDYPQVIESVGLKNLLPVTAESDTVDGVTYTVNEDGSVVVNGSGRIEIEGKFISGFSYCTVGTVTLPPGTYCLTGVPDVETGLYTAFQLEPWTADGALARFINNVFTLNTTTTVDFKIAVYGGPFENVIVKPMLRICDSNGIPIGSDEFTPYGQSEVVVKVAESTISIPLTEPLRAIGAVKDEICIQNGVYGVLRRLGRFVFTGLTSEGWKPTYSGVSGKFRVSIESSYVTSVMKKASVDTDIIPSMCNLFTPASSKDTWDTIEGISVDVHGKIRIYSERFNVYDLTEWQNFLAENNMIFDYELANPVFEPFEDQSIFLVLTSADERTFISVENISDNLSPELEVFYPGSEEAVEAMSALIEGGEQVGYEEGREAGYADGYNAGTTGDSYDAIYNTGYEAGESAGYESGYTEGQTAGINSVKYLECFSSSHRIIYAVEERNAGAESYATITYKNHGIESANITITGIAGGQLVEIYGSADGGLTNLLYSSAGKFDGTSDNVSFYYNYNGNALLSRYIIVQTYGLVATANDDITANVVFNSFK